MSTHEVSEVEPVLDMVAVVLDGQVKEIDEVDNIRGRYGLSLVEWMKERLKK
jgi:ABC-2 type transport system ATP-binding protein